MTLPANDAFSLGLAHDQPRRASSRSRTPSIPRRSSSPKILFSSPSATPSPTPLPGGMPAKRAHRRKHAANQGSQHSIRLSAGESTIEELVEEADTRRSTSFSPKRKSKHGRTNSTPDGTASPPNGLHKQNAAAIDWEVPRKALHSSIGFFTVYLYASNGDPRHVIIALSSALAVLIPIDFLRLRYPSLEYAFEKCVGIFMRDSEKKSSNGVIWYTLGVNAVLVTLPLDIAVVSVLVLSWADTAASTFGRLYGSRTPPLPKRLFGIFPLAPRKSLAGFTAATLTGAAIATGFWALLAPAREHGLTWTWQDGDLTELHRRCSRSTWVPADIRGMGGLAHDRCRCWTRDRHCRGSWCVFYYRVYTVSTDGIGHLGVRSRWGGRQSEFTDYRWGMSVGHVQDAWMAWRDAGMTPLRPS
ncbi:hypothetical protein J3R83DRAFT_13561 [Lanmaoa asiatica]|nr:hypothetical protein J3R83DRAFT_13561 [Lanmaoa asiatica]